MGAIAAEVFCGILSVFGVVIAGFLVAKWRWRVKDGRELERRFTFSSPTAERGLPFIGAACAIDGYKVAGTTWYPASGVLDIRFERIGPE